MSIDSMTVTKVIRSEVSFKTPPSGARKENKQSLEHIPDGGMQLIVFFS